jgi:hypothetical protein
MRVLFGLNGLNAEYLAALHASLPLESLPAGTTSVYADLP